MSIGAGHFAVLSALVFAAGVAGAVLRRHALGMLIGVALMMTAPLIALTGFSKAGGGSPGQALILMAAIAMAAQALVAAGVLTMVWRRRESADVEDLDNLMA